MTGLPPEPPQVILGCLAVLGGCVAAAVSLSLGRRTGNWLHHVGAAGAVLFVIGIAGQRPHPSGEAIASLGAAAAGAAPGPWDAGIRLPLIGVAVTPVALVGLLMTLMGLSLVLFFERLSAEPDGPAPAETGDLEDLDSA